MPKKYRSDAFAAIHETMEALHEAGAVDKQMMREFDEACLTPIHVLAPEKIEEIRRRDTEPPTPPQVINHPPATSITCPVMKLASAEVSHAQASATSSGVPNLRKAVSSITA